MIKNLEDLFSAAEIIKVPSYQRAYAWEEEQWSQFVKDIHSMKEQKEYYYGHFIIEKSNNTYELIDGQQRITTFIIFLIICQLYKKESYEKYISKFETVDYDQESFQIIQNKITHTNNEWKFSDFELRTEQTLSIKRVIDGLNYFNKLFKDEKSDLRLDQAEIDNYTEIITKAHISIHITCSKSIAVQIFELQNTRGLKLSLIEKLKSKLMKKIYLITDNNSEDLKISMIQNNFAEIYRNEETISSNAFRGSMALEDILFHHLRVVDDGDKLSSDNSHHFNTPYKSTEKEKSIFDYLENKFNEKSRESIIEYIINFTCRFKESVELISNILPKLDEYNRLIGDVFILDKNLSLEFFILVYHYNKIKLNYSIEENIKLLSNENVIRLWEILLYTRDFHDKYYRLRYTDNFENLFKEYVNSAGQGNILNILNQFVENGFRPDSMDNKKLVTTVMAFIERNKNTILSNAFHWHTEKMVYLIYKFEISKGTNLLELRKIMKGGRSIEHILPQQWDWKWINEKEPNVSISEEGKVFNEKIKQIINGIGNLLLLSSSENSRLSNTHPMDKSYNDCSGGSYTLHNKNSKQWENYNNWEKIINQRGTEIYEFLTKELIKCPNEATYPATCSSLKS